MMFNQSIFFSHTHIHEAMVHVRSNSSSLSALRKLKRRGRLCNDVRLLFYGNKQNSYISTVHEEDSHSFSICDERLDNSS